MAVATAIVGALVVAPQAAADDTIWVMPNVQKASLASAIDEILAVSDPVELKITPSDNMGNRQIIVEKNWIVCWQWPAAGDEISQKGKSVSLGVRRVSDDGCSWE